MGFRCAIVGLPNVGKSTIFNAMTESGVAAENYPFCTIEPNVGRVMVRDKRMKEIQKYIPTNALIFATMEFVDVAGLVRGASKGEGLGNQFLGHIRETDAIVHVVRCFDSQDIIHVEGSVDPLRDIDVIESELILADHETLLKGLNRHQKLLKSGDKKAMIIVAMLEALNEHLQAMKPARTFLLKDHIKDTIEVEHAYRDLHLITAKKVLFACNVSEDDAAKEDNEYTKKVRDYALKNGAEIVVLCGKIEEEIVALDEEEREAMICDLGMKEAGLDRMIRAGYKLLGLETYFTAGEKEIRAWTIKKGASAPEAAGVIHSDFERGFICAEVFTLEDLNVAKNRGALKSLGRLRIEGRDYKVKDGDIMEFRFNV